MVTHTLPTKPNQTSVRLRRIATRTDRHRLMTPTETEQGFGHQHSIEGELQSTRSVHLKRIIIYTDCQKKREP